MRTLTPPPLQASHQPTSACCSRGSCATSRRWPLLACAPAAGCWSWAAGRVSERGWDEGEREDTGGRARPPPPLRPPCTFFLPSPAPHNAHTHAHSPPLPPPPPPPHTRARQARSRLLLLRRQQAAAALRRRRPATGATLRPRPSHGASRSSTKRCGAGWAGGWVGGWVGGRVGGWEGNGVMG